LPIATNRTEQRSRTVLRWLFGATVLGLVVYLVVHFSTAEAFVSLLQHSRPSWLLLALAMQVATYGAEGAMWQAAAKAGHHEISSRSTYCMSVAKLAVDQAIPVGGVGGNILFVQGLEREGVPLETALAAVVTTTFSYYVCYALCLSLALMLGVGHKHTMVIDIGSVLILLSFALAIVVLLQPGAAPGSPAARIAHLPILRWVLVPLQRGDVTVARSSSLLLRSTIWQLVIVCLDSGTLWACLRAVDTLAPIDSVFVAFMFTSILETLNISANGVGTFEAVAVLMLRSFGIPTAAALSATLLFRGVSLALPMIPGVLYMRRLSLPSGSNALTGAAHR